MNYSYNSRYSRKTLIIHKETLNIKKSNYKGKQFKEGMPVLNRNNLYDIEYPFNQLNKINAPTLNDNQTKKGHLNNIVMFPTTMGPSCHADYTKSLCFYCIACNFHKIPSSKKHRKETSHYLKTKNL